jgi:hypothetical protein
MTARTTSASTTATGSTTSGSAATGTSASGDQLVGCGIRLGGALQSEASPGWSSQRPYEQQAAESGENFHF